MLHQPAIVRHDLALWEVEPHLQGNQHGELQRYQLSPVDAETLLQLLFIQGDEQRDERSMRTLLSETDSMTANTLPACTFPDHNMRADSDHMTGRHTSALCSCYSNHLSQVSV